MNLSTLFKLNSQDFVKGLIVAILTALIAYLGDLTTLLSADPTLILKIAITAGISYLLKNFISDENGKVLGIGK